MGSSSNHEINGQYGQKELFSISSKSVIQGGGVAILYLGLTELLFLIFTKKTLSHFLKSSLFPIATFLIFGTYIRYMLEFLNLFYDLGL